MRNKKVNVKNFEIGSIDIKMRPNGFPEGFILKRDLTTRECRYIMKKLLGINITTKDECYDTLEYNDYNEELVSSVNKWLRGECDDEYIMEYTGDGSDEPIGIFNLIPIIEYLQKIQVI